MYVVEINVSVVDICQFYSSLWAFCWAADEGGNCEVGPDFEGQNEVDGFQKPRKNNMDDGKNRKISAFFGVQSKHVQSNKLCGDKPKNTDINNSTENNNQENAEKDGISELQKLYETETQDFEDEVIESSNNLLNENKSSVLERLDDSWIYLIIYPILL